MKHHSQHIPQLPTTQQGHRRHTAHSASLLTVHHSETTLPQATRHTLAQLRTNKCLLLRSYLNKSDEVPSLQIRTTHSNTLQLHQYKHTTTGHRFVDGSRRAG